MYVREVVYYLTTIWCLCNRSQLKHSLAGEYNVASHLDSGFHLLPAQIHPNSYSSSFYVYFFLYLILMS